MSRTISEKRSRKSKARKIYQQSGWNYLSVPTSRVRVDEETALTYSALYRAVNIFSGIIGSLPFDVFRFQGGGKRKKAIHGHPVWKLIERRPNDEQTPFVFRETLTANLALWGNCYAEIERNDINQPIKLHYLPSRYVTVNRDETGLYYEYRNDTGGIARLEPRDVFHVPLFGDGIVGKSPITLARESIGAGIAMTEFSGAFYGNAGIPGGVLEHPGNPTDKAVAQIRESWNSVHQGSKNAFKLMILREGMKYSTIGMKLADAQFVETGEMRIKDISRWYGIPLALLAEGGDQGGKTLDEHDRAFTKYSLNFWVKRWEEEIDRKLLRDPDADSGELFCRFNLDELLRGDPAARFNTYAIGRQWGIYNSDECREREDLDPIPDGAGQVFWQPVNVVSVGGPVPFSPKTPTKLKVQDEEPEQKSLAWRAVFIPLFRDVFGRLSHREEKRLQTICRKNADAMEPLAEAIGEFYREFEEDVARDLSPVFEAMSALGIPRADVGAEASRFVEESRRPLLDIIRNGGTLDQLTETIDRRARNRAEIMAAYYTRDIANATPNAT